MTWTSLQGPSFIGSLWSGWQWQSARRSPCLASGLCCVDILRPFARDFETLSILDLAIKMSPVAFITAVSAWLAGSLPCHNVSITCNGNVWPCIGMCVGVPLTRPLVANQLWCLPSILVHEYRCFALFTNQPKVATKLLKIKSARECTDGGRKVQACVGIAMFGTTHATAPVSQSSHIIPFITLMFLCSPLA